MLYTQKEGKSFVFVLLLVYFDFVFSILHKFFILIFKETIACRMHFYIESFICIHHGWLVSLTFQT